MVEFDQQQQQAESKEPILVYHDAHLFQEDIELFKKGRWLNDNCILFFYEYLSHQVFQDAVSSKLIKFIHPSASFAMRFLDSDDLINELKLLQAHEYKWLFCPVNNNKNVDTSGGTHWSLLIMDVDCLVGYHFDTCHQTNIELATEQAGRIFRTLIAIQNAVPNIDADPKLSPNLKVCSEVLESNTPQQYNGDDCGVYILMFSEKCANMLIDSINPETSIRNVRSDLEDEIIDIQQSDVDNMRERLSNLSSTIENT